MMKEVQIFLIVSFFFFLLLLMMVLLFFCESYSLESILLYPAFFFFLCKCDVVRTTIVYCVNSLSFTNRLMIFRFFFF